MQNLTLTNITHIILFFNINVIEKLFMLIGQHYLC